MHYSTHQVRWDFLVDHKFYWLVLWVPFVDSFSDSCHFDKFYLEVYDFHVIIYLINILFLPKKGCFFKGFIAYEATYILYDVLACMNWA